MTDMIQAGMTQHVMSDAGVEAHGLSIDFPIYHGHSRSLKQTVFAAASGRFGRDQHKRVVVHAVQNVSFSLQRGERLALIGGNGAGKTTLLRALAGIYEPVQGWVRVQGSINALLDPGFGMNPELTGRENIRLRALINGLSRDATAALEQDVQEFAEIGEFLDLPVRFYSSGMVVRLGFGIATAIHPKVLMMDEWFLAGDSIFMEKARTRLEALVRNADILVLSSHVETVVLEWATRVIWMEGGKVQEDGPAAQVMDLYRKRDMG
jgi:lipopolysaccharide transport system ATP-binding protein